ncbi:SDR family oxidoreductase [Aquirufa nivalisilvae]
MRLLYSNIKIGDSATVIHTITQNDIEKFVELTGDDNKLHIDQEFAQKTEFKKPVVHGMLGASFISTLIGTKLPGDGALWYSQTLEFLRPVRVGDTISVKAVVIQKNDKINSIELKTEILNQNKQVVTTGISKVKLVNVEEAISIEEIEHKELRKTVIVLGATGGIGHEIAKQLASNGYDLILHYNQNRSKIDSIIHELTKFKVKIFFFQSNLIDDESFKRFVNSALDLNINIYGIVNATTIPIPAISFNNLEWNHIQKQIDINIKSNFNIVQAFLPHFVNKNNGKFVFISTQYTDSPISEMNHYITAKSALNGFVKSLAFEYAGKGITFNMVSPSMIDTDLVADVPQKYKMLLQAKNPTKRLCTVSDVATAIIFLLSENTGFITGETIRINGGLIMI